MQCTHVHLQCICNVAKDHMVVFVHPPQEQCSRSLCDMRSGEQLLESTNSTSSMPSSRTQSWTKSPSSAKTRRAAFIRRPVSWRLCLCIRLHVNMCVCGGGGMWVVCVVDNQKGILKLLIRSSLSVLM